LIAGALATVPAALLAGALAGDFFFMHLVYKGEIRDFWVGDAFGDLLCVSFFGVVFVVLGSIPWVRAYRRL
jgi:hypothetical protein